MHIIDGRISVVIAVGAVAERGRTLRAMLFVFVRSNVVHAFIAKTGLNFVLASAASQNAVRRVCGILRPC